MHRSNSTLTFIVICNSLSLLPLHNTAVVPPLPPSGTAVVTQTKATLWTDSRYWVQAERQMDCNWELEKDGRGDRMLLTCYDSTAAHTDSSKIFVCFVFFSRNSPSVAEPVNTGFM